jgi:phosphomannomutase/phosphoglucomutase
VRATGADVGIAWDGDGDRLGAVDENGEIIWGDKLMVLFSRALLASTRARRSSAR